MKKNLILMGIAALMISSCSNQPKSETTLSGLDPKAFETKVNDHSVNLYTLKNKNGMEVCITNFGGRIVSVMVPDKNGNMKDVVLGFDSIADYVNIPSDFGASIGRYANRIKDGKIVIDGDTIQLPQNNFGHCLHGGPKGWQYQVYEAKQIDGTKLELVRQSPDGDENFPGNVTAKVTYTLTDDNSIDISYEATTDKKTVINMTNHSYFNLSGDAQKPITDHLLYVNADKFTPVDSTFMTTGEILDVKGTPMDFTVAKTVGQDIDKYEYDQLKNGNGYDHNWVLNTNGDIKQVAARLTSPVSGITLEVYTDEPGIQVYSGNFLDGTVKGKKSIVYNQRAAICLETQHYPDSPNKPEWPSVLLEPGKTYRSHCIFKFTVNK
ncbi:MAG: aldose epimerase family protein [Bacteroides graminisolvens]|jgi:aldose 1-epimerase|uniref:Aldose 1-epimerase n=1 Tax=Bacteroides graminisolvens TaxID=477666 RepID=A0A351M366_9BACE|nr:aldose epimerase family protein [Bacteroides graminisolvens]MBP6069442.1 galactose mutarotase [Bacteroides sp.]MBP6248224.1 galactose mutarotase [Bacteroides sp.]MBP7293724.1 galactose mutarotase [Bacteroides sp.]MBP9495437.1 galactose mutarotase [Bacteroides sp.]MBP9552749.1 galactose mutarotase [Bacteroides sp.]